MYAPDEECIQRAKAGDMVDEEAERCPADRNDPLEFVKNGTNRLMNLLSLCSISDVDELFLLPLSPL